MESDIKVSVICCAYNQESYIEDALKGFIRQKTEFGFEVLISDDASSDRTPDIIKKYAQKYPDLIKPLIFTENQFSKGVYPGVLLVKRALGDYLAFCEGDDYWISDYKLQKQYEAMIQHPECDMCAHSAFKVRPDNCSVIGKIEPMDTDGILTMEQVIDGGGDYIATNSLFFKKTILTNPTPYLRYSGFDYAYQISGAQRGGIVYLHETMSAYRRGAKNSWTVTMMHSKNEVMIRHIDKMITMLDMVDEETQHKYENNILFAKQKYEFQKAALKGDSRTVFSKDYKFLRDKMSMKRKFILLLQCYAPWSITLYQKIMKSRRAY